MSAVSFPSLFGGSPVNDKRPKNPYVELRVDERAEEWVRAVRDVLGQTTPVDGDSRFCAYLWSLVEARCLVTELDRGREVMEWARQVTGWRFPVRADDGRVAYRSAVKMKRTDGSVDTAP